MIEDKKQLEGEPLTGTEKFKQLNHPSLLKLIKKMRIKNLELQKRKIKNRKKDKMGKQSRQKNRYLKYGR